MKIVASALAALAILVGTGRAYSQDGAAGTAPQDPLPAPTLPPAVNPTPMPLPSQPVYPVAPAYAFPPSYYPYSPGYGYPGLTYPPAYPPYPPAYPQFQGEQLPLPAAAPEPMPEGRWRIGVAGILFPTGNLSYKLSVRGESILAYPSSSSANPGNAATTLGVAPFVQFQAAEYLYLGLSVQYIPNVKWKPASSTSTNQLYGGSASELDLLPQLGITIPVARRVQLLFFGAVGYSLVFASDLVKVYADPGTAHGLLVQSGAGLLYALGGKGFLEMRGSYQWGFQNNQVQSSTSGQNWDIEVHSQYLGMQCGGGFWF